MESRSDFLIGMENTVDLKGDIFGIALGAFTLLAGRVVTKYITSDNFHELPNKFLEKTKKLAEDAPKKFENFAVRLGEKLINATGPRDAIIDNCASEYARLVRRQLLDK